MKSPHDVLLPRSAPPNNDAGTPTPPIEVAAIRASGLRKQFRSTDGSTVVAVDDVDLTVRPGEIVAFLGPNGAGKTTTVDMLLGLTRPDAGSIEVYGAEPGAAVRAGRVSAVMQTGGLLGDFTVEETVRAIAALHGRTDRVEVVLERARLTGLAGRRVQACSGGEQQRLKFALALVPDPDLVVLDEPTTGMDVGARQEFWRAMREDAALGRTIVFATHYLAEADEFAERTVLMNHGRILHDAATTDVRAAYGGRGLRVVDPDLAAESLIDGPSPLTARERELLTYALDGSPVAAIAARVHLSEGTVRNHLSAAIGKTGATTRSEAARIAQDRGWL